MMGQAMHLLAALQNAGCFHVHLLHQHSVLSQAGCNQTQALVAVLQVLHNLLSVLPQLVGVMP
jgi:hypothetical protein